MKVKEESEKVGLKLNIQKTKITASGPITSWEIDGETVSDLIFLGSKITADGDCSHEIIRCLLLGRIAMTNLDSILKIRDITLPTKVHLVKAMFFQYHVWMWELDYKESWVPKNWCFWNVVLRRLLRVPWAARRSSQSLLKEISPEYSLKDCYWSWNFITLATWCKELTYWKRPCCWERLKAKGEGGGRGWDGY